MGKIVNKKELAEILDVSERALTDWQNDEGLPILKRGARGESHDYDFKAVLDWLIEREVKKIRSLSPRDEGIMLDNELKKRALAEKDRTLVPASEVAPLWNGRVLAAAAFLSHQHSRLAGILEATPGIEKKREILRDVFSSFLILLGVNGEAMQFEVERLLSALPAEEAAAFMRRIDAIGSPSLAGDST